MHPPNLKKYPPEIKSLHATYMKKGFWVQYNWYDFLELFIKYLKTNDHHTTTTR